jgi:beta-galactosidase
MQSIDASYIRPAGTRDKFCFNADWQFIQENVEGAQAQVYDDSDWTRVGVPHTYNERDTFDEFSPSSHRGEMNQWGGKTWYRKTFQVPAEWAGRRVYIEFEAVRQVAEVWLNGVYLGKCENGFLPFGFDLTEHLNVGVENVLALRCDNSFDTDSLDGVSIDYPNEGDAKFPWNNPHWHPAHGGIYRNVYLHVTGQVQVTLPLFSHLGTTGTYVYAENISRESADVTVEAQVANHTQTRQQVVLAGQILNREGDVVATWTETQHVDAGALAEFSHMQCMRAPQLWEPDYPYLYTARVVLSVDGVETDGCDTTFGIRTVVYNRFTGFFINDRYLKLEGWGQKSTNEWAGLGSALPDWMQYYTSALMREAGGNFVRWGHTAGSPAQITSSDRLGLVTIQPGVDGELDAEGHDWDVRATAFRYMIIYYRNSASILIWEGGNQSVTIDHITQLKAYVDQYDPKGGRAYAHRRANTTIEPWLDLSISTEGSGYLPNLPTVEGEYNREEAPRRVWDRKTPPYENYHAIGSYDLTAEDFARNQATHYAKIAPKSHAGGGNWIFSDSTSGGRVDSEVTRTSGQVDAVRLPKEAYYVCQAIFSEAPTVHIIGHWNYPAGTSKDIWVASNQQEVELFLNDVSHGRVAADASSPYLFKFAAVDFAAGVLRAVAYDQNGVEKQAYSLETTGPVVALRLSSITAPTGFRADGTDVALIDVEAVDAVGRRVPTYNERIDFALSGPAIWRGGYNSGKEYSTNNLWLDLESGINRVAIRSIQQAGEVCLRATADALPVAEIHLDALADTHADSSGQWTPTLPVVPYQTTLIAPPLPPEQDKMDSKITSADVKAESSRFFTQISYSGPGGLTKIVSKPKTGDSLYSDYILEAEEIPEILQGGEMLTFPEVDVAYSAVDLAQMEIVEDTDLYLCHDVSLSPPEWLLASFDKTPHQMAVRETRYDLYHTQLRAGATLLLGGNQELNPVPHGRMFIVFATELCVPN